MRGGPLTPTSLLGVSRGQGRVVPGRRPRGLGSRIIAARRPQAGSPLPSVEQRDEGHVGDNHGAGADQRPGSEAKKLQAVHGMTCAFMAALSASVSQYIVDGGVMTMAPISWSGTLRRT